MKLGVISDTHLRQPTRELEGLMAGPFREVEMILHAGDITESAVLDIFRRKELRAVCGNMDSPEVCRQLPARIVVEAGKFRVGLIHGWGAPLGIEERIRGEFEGVDCIVHGHTHAASRNRREGVFFFNPGSFGGNFSGKKSVGLLELTDQISSQILYF